MCDMSKVPLNKLLTLLNNIEQQQIQLEQDHEIVFEEINKRFPGMLEKDKPKVYVKKEGK